MLEFWQSEIEHLLAFTFGLGMPYISLTWSELRERLKDRTDCVPFWSADELLDATNESLRLWNVLVGQWRRQAVVPTVANQYLYALPSTLLYRTRVTFTSLPLSSSSREELNLGRPRWRSETTTTGGDVPTRPTLFAPVSLQSIYIWPADAVGGTNLLVDGVSVTPVLVEDGDTLDLSSDTIDPILGLAQHILTFKKAGEAFSLTEPLFKAFLKAAAEQNSLIKTSTVYRRAMGLDQRALKPFRGVPTELDQIAGVTRA